MVPVLLAAMITFLLKAAEYSFHCCDFTSGAIILLLVVRLLWGQHCEMELNLSILLHRFPHAESVMVMVLGNNKTGTAENCGIGLKIICIWM